MEYGYRTNLLAAETASSSLYLLRHNLTKPNSRHSGLDPESSVFYSDTSGLDSGFSWNDKYCGIVNVVLSNTLKLN